jgi:hypothetical protein
MLICTYSDGYYYRIVDTEDIEVGDSDFILDYAKVYTKDEVKYKLQTENILGLDENTTDLIDFSKMWLNEEDFYVNDIYMGVENPYIVISNKKNVYVYRKGTDSFVAQLDIIDNLDMQSIYPYRDTISISYLDNKRMAVIEQVYKVTKNGIVPESDKIHLTYLGNPEVLVKRPVKVAYADELMQNLGISAQSIEGIYEVIEEVMYVGYQSKDDVTYLVTDGLILSYKDDDDEFNVVYQEVA